MTQINNVAKNCLLRNLALKNTESILIICDPSRKEIGGAFEKEAIKITKKVKRLTIPTKGENAEEPEDNVAKEMLNHQVIVIVTKRSLSHTNARKNASKKGARISSMPGITKEIMLRCIEISYDKMIERTNKIANALAVGKTVRITTDKGTDITMDIGKITKIDSDTGIYDKKESWGNLPAGEASLAPVEGKTFGTFIADASFAGVGILKKPIRITVKNGYATLIEGGIEAKKLDSLLKKVSDKKAYNIAELGIGTNEKAIITGNILEDEKVIKTCHIALGNNTSYQFGKANVPIHLDGVIRNPTITIDNKKIIDKGILLL